MTQIKVILSCEHAVNTIPPDYSHYFKDYKSLLNTHRGLDIGALEVAKHLSKSFNYSLFSATISRLLIDCNRSLKSKTCFSELSRELPAEEKNRLIQHYYLPFRNKVEQFIQDNIANGYKVWHLSIHSFTPILNGIPRHADVGFLYDPKRVNEQKIARTWQNLLRQHSPLHVRLNYPYRGISDGFTTSLRKQYSANDYLGIEIECKQSITQDKAALAKLNVSLVKTFKLLLSNY